MVDRFKEICAQRPDLRVLLYMLGEEKILEWIQTVGVCEDEVLRKFIPPFPPLELRQITAAADLPEFLWTGLVDMDRIMTLYEKAANYVNIESPTILDFGCGCGRMVRFLNNYSVFNTIHACEVNPDHVDWCRDNLSNVQVSRCNVLPPLPYKDQMFNLIYVLSVFTHLSETTRNNFENLKAFYCPLLINIIRMDKSVSIFTTSIGNFEYVLIALVKHEELFLKTFHCLFCGIRIKVKHLLVQGRIVDYI